MPRLTLQNLTWVNLVRPTPAELLQLQQEYQFHELDIEDCLSEHERPKIDEYENYLFIVLHIPYFSQETKRILKEEVNIFIGHNYIITLHDGHLDVLNALWQKCAESEEERKLRMGEGTGFFLYELTSLFFGSCFPLIDNINRQLRVLEGTIFEHEGERVLRLILELKRSIISLRRILLPQRTIIADLEHKSKKFVPEELDVYFDDVQDAIERQWAVLETAKEVIEAFHGSHDSWIRSKTDRIIRILTILSVTMLPLSVITGLFGMNVSIPYAQYPLAFWTITFSLAGFLIASFAYFVWRKWL